MMDKPLPMLRFQFISNIFATILVVLLAHEALQQESPTASNRNQPHIIFIVADDLGWADVSIHGSPQIPTPNIDQLAREGITLTNYYVSPICSPTRSAIMTGKHPIHTGMQHDTIGAGEPWGLPLKEKTMADHLKNLGYSTHAVGKWHLGYFANEYTPRWRGFDSFFGFYEGKGDHFTHQDGGGKIGLGYDLHKNEEVYWPAFGQYSTEIFTEGAQDVIRGHNASQPLFLYLAHQAVHAGIFKGQFVQAPHKYYKRFPNIKPKGRKGYAAMVSALDDSVGEIVQSLREAGLYDNSVIVFTTDNGGPTHYYDGNHASNWPLRGCKHTLWEGGVRGTAFIHSPLLKDVKRFDDTMMHMTDWLPTLYGVAGGDPDTLTGLDGYDVWDALSKMQPSPRNEILHNIDTVFGYAAIRMGDYKLLYGAFLGSFLAGWYPPEGLNLSDTKPVPESYVVKCRHKPANASTNCNYRNKKPCLYNIHEDPCEYNNIAESNPEIVDTMTARIREYAKTAVEPLNKPYDPRSNPSLHGGAWVPWETLPEDNRHMHL